MNQPGGSGNSGNNFCQTVLTDAAASSIQNITVAQNPYIGSFRPTTPLSAFIGETAAGTWVLNGSDRAALDTGGIRAFTLSTRGFSCAP